MIRLFTMLFVALIVAQSALAQVTVTASAGYGPFAQGQSIQNVFSVAATDPYTRVDSVTFQITSVSGTTTRTWASQTGSRTTFSVNMSILPWTPEPQLVLTAYLRPTNSGSPYTVGRVEPITIVAPPVSYTASNNFAPVRIGYPHTATYNVTNLPANTTQATLALVDPAGTVVATNTVNGTALTQGTLTYSTQKYPGALRLRASIRYALEPPGGYTVPEQIVPDSIPAPIVSASAGFGPFRTAVDVQNTFVVQGLGPACLSVQWSIQYITPFGEFRAPVTVSRTYNTQQDSMHFVYNMRDVSAGSSLVVTAVYGTFAEQSSTTSYPITIVTSQTAPVYRFNDTLPMIFGQNKLDTVVLDSLPQRITTLTMLLTTASGTQLQQAQYNTTTPNYVRSGQLTFNVKDLAVGSYFIRSTFQNDINDDPVEFDYQFDVRDTSTFYLVADTWGPFTQGDSATITPAITDIRPVTGTKPDKVLGLFTVIDTLNPSAPLTSSVYVDLSGVASRDSIVYWPDSSYAFGSSDYNRGQVQVSGLPLTAAVTFERLIVRGSDTTRDTKLTRAIIMVPPPGVLSSVPGLDTAFTVTRSANLTFTLSNITPDATEIKFAVLGMKDLTPVAQQQFAVPPGSNSVSWFVNPGLLPVNAKVVVSAITPTTNDNGAEIVRLINTAPDSLAMTSSAPIDTLRLTWNVDPSSKLIRGVVPYTPTFTFSRIPAQTTAITVMSFNDRGAVIDSIRVAVPYRTSYDSQLTVSTPFSFRAFNTSSLQVTYLSDGGPLGGVRYTRQIVSIPPQLSASTQKINTRTVPVSNDPTPVHQGSTDIVDMKFAWSPSASGVGYSSALPIDSVQLQVLDCSGVIIDQHTVRPAAANAATGVIADTMYAVTKLPLSTAQIRYAVFSQAMTLPVTGVSASAPMSLVSSPVLSIPLGFSYPSYRVTDTTALTLSQSMYLTNVNGLFEIDSVSFVDKLGRKAYTFASQRPRLDTIWFPQYDFNQLDPDNAPYIVTGILRTQACTQPPPAVDTLGRIDVPRVLNDPSQTNWVFSSKGWGPFQQGRAPVTQLVANFNPAAFVTTRSAVGDSLEVGIVGFSEQFGTFTTEVPAKYSYPANQTLPASARTRTAINLNPFDTVSSLALHVRWIRKEQTGTSVALDQLYKFPVAMIEFPDQPIFADSSGFEQSVLAGSSSTAVMQDYYNFRLEPASSFIDYLRFTFTSSTGNVLDTFSITPVSQNFVDTTSVFTMSRDVAQYPWPYVARDRTIVPIAFGYQFTGANRPTKIQRTSISILPRADWLNGTVATLDGTATSTSVPVKVSIPMPASTYSVVAPLFGSVQTGIVSALNDLNTDLVVKASYNPVTKQFSMRGGDPSDEFWTPSVSLFGGANISYKNTAADGEKSGEFSALYRFEQSTLADEAETTVENRELRVRSLWTSNFSANSGMAEFIKEIGEVIGELVGDATEEATGGMVKVKPLFVVGGSIKQVSTINIGTEESGSLVHINESAVPTQNTEPNEFPTSQAVGLTLTGGGGLELSFFTGIFGVGATITNDNLFAAGTTYYGAINHRGSLLYPQTMNPSVWFNLEISMLWGLIKIDVFRGRLYQWWSPAVMPSFPVFSEPWESIFASVERTKGERTQSIRPIAKLPDETPYYRPAPALSANSNALVSVHLEHTGLDNSGRLVLSSLNTKTHVLQPAVLISANRNAMHDPAVTLVGQGGNAFVAWLQNDRDAGREYGQYSYYDLLKTENIYAAFYDAATKKVQQLPDITDVSREMIDGKPCLAAAYDSSNAMIAWPALELDSSYSDVYVRRIFKTNTGWQFGDARLISRLSGSDRDVNVSALKNGSYLVTWINDGTSSSSAHTVYAALVAEDGSSTVSVGPSVDAATSISDVELVSNGVDAAILFGRTYADSTNEFSRALDIYSFQGPLIHVTWPSRPATLNVGDAPGVYRHVEADLNEDGTFFAMVNSVDHNGVAGSSEHALISCTGSINESPSSWKIHRNKPAFYDAKRSIWSMSTTIGPNNVFYIATQELDSVRQNKQVYRNGLQLGPARLNAVVRAMKLLPNGELVPVPFGNQPTSVAEQGQHEELEAALRYRISMMDAAPNPAREACVVPLAVQRPSRIEAFLVDALGQRVATVYQGDVAVGIQGLSFEVAEFPSGHYSVVLSDDYGIVGSVPVVIVH